MLSPGGIGGSNHLRSGGGGEGGGGGGERGQPQPSPRVDPDHSQRSGAGSNMSASERASFPAAGGILRLARRRPSVAHGSISRSEGARLSDEAQAEEAAQAKLEKEAPIRGLAKELSGRDMFAVNPKGNSLPNHSRTPSNSVPNQKRTNNSGAEHKRSGSSALGLFFQSHVKGTSSGTKGEVPQPGVPADSAAAVVAAQTASAVIPQGQEQPIIFSDGRMKPQHLEEGLAAGTVSDHPPSIKHPDTPPLLGGGSRRISLIHARNSKGEPQDTKSESDLMIGEIKSIQITDEIALARKALVLIAVSLVGASLIRHFAGPLDADVNIIEIVGFVSTLLLSYPVIRFTVRLFAFFVTTKASALLYRGNSFYFAVALHQDISITIWCIIAVYVWKELFPQWVYSTDREELPRRAYELGDNLLQCFLALRVGILVKNFLVLLVATSYLWRPYLKRVQSSILAQYILLLLTDYCTTGTCNPSDQRFAIEMGRQDIKEDQNISLYAVSKAMGFIPRNKLGHVFFRELAGSETLDSSRDATAVGTYMFDQLVLRHRELMMNSPAPSSPDRLRGLGALFTTVGANVLGVGGNNTVGIHHSTSFASTLSSRSLRGLRSNTDKRASIPASFFGAEKRGSLSPKRPPRSATGGSRSSDSSGTASGDRDSGARTPRMGSGAISRPRSGGVNRPRSGTAPGSVEAATNGGRSGGGSSVEGSAARSRSNTVDAPEAQSGGGGGAFEGFRGFFGGLTRAERLSVIEDDESVTGSTYSVSLTRGGGGAGAQPGHDSGGKAAAAAAAGGEDGGGIPDLRAALAPKHASDAAKLEKLARVAAQNGRSFSTVEGDSSDGDGAPADDAASVAAAVPEAREKKATATAGRASGEGRGRGRGGGGDQGEEKDDGGGSESTSESHGSTRKGSEGDEDRGEEEVLTRETLCPVLEDQVLDNVFKIFDLNDNGSVTKEEMVLGVVNTFKDHRSLAHTLKDSEHIARKLGLIIMAVVFFVLVFVWLSIWGADVVSLSLTFASFLIAFSFLIGTEASNLMAAILFIFVSRVYDVGDRVHIYDSSTTVDAAPMNVTVWKVDLRTTAFRRWDEQIFYIPNHLLATKTIVNIQRTADQWHEFFIHVSVSTPSKKLDRLRNALKSFAESKDKAEGLYPRTGFSLLGIEDSTRLSIRITFRQRGNWQNMDKKWACQSMCTWAIKNACETIGITYAMPEVPIVLKSKMT